jgi:hypothetical protein
MRALLASLLLVTCSAHAALEARDIDLDGVVDAYFDSDQNLSFAADANLAESLVPHSLHGLMPLQDALSFAAGVNIAGLSGWRLPRLTETLCDGTICMPVSSELSLLPELSAFRNVQMTEPHALDSILPNNALPFPYWIPRNNKHSSTKDAAIGFFAVWVVHDGDVSAIPEPSTWALMLFGVGALIAARQLNPRRTK